MAQRVIKKSTLNDEVKRNLSSFANTIISKMQTASNPSNSPDQNRTMVNELLAQFNMSSSIYKEEDKPQSPQSAVFEDGFQQMVIDYFTRIMDGMNDLMNEVKTVTCDTKVLKSLISNRKSEKVMNCKQLAEKYSYTIPLPTVEDFERFDRELDNPYSTLRLDLNSVLPSGLDTGLVVSKCIVKMLKMFISKDVAIQYTAVKQAKNKRIMRITNLFNSIEALIKERRSQVKLITTDKEMTAALSDVMSNAQHWKNQQQYEQNKSQTNQTDPGRCNQDPSLQSDASSSYLPSNDGYPLCEVQYLDSDKRSSRENKTLPQTVFQNDFQQMVIDYFVRIMNGMNDLTNEVRDVANDTKIIKSLFANKEGEKIMSCKQLAEKYSYTIPIPSMEEFERFDRELGNPQSSLKSDLASVLPSGLDSGLVLSKCIVKMLKMLITKDVAVQFTAVKQANRKKIMKSTNFFNSIEALIKERRSQISLTTLDKDITAALSDVMSNAPNWKRQQQADQNQHQSTWQIHQARNDQETSFQGDSMSSYELLSLNETEPLFETKYFNAL